MTQTDLEQEEFEQDNQDQSQSAISSGSVEDGKEKFKIMIHKILGVADTKQIDKICCFFKINKQWSLTQQLFCTYSLFLTFFMVTILGYFVFYLKFSPNYVGYTILQQIDGSITNNFNNSLQEYSKQVHQYFKSYSSQMIMFSELFSNHVGWSNSIFQDQKYMNIDSKKRYFSAKEPTPSDLINGQYSNKSPYNKGITLETFQYLSLNPDDQSTLSQQTKTILNSVDILSYFYKSFMFDQSISNLQSLYIFIEERDLFCMYPGGITDDNLKSRTRPWYLNTIETFKKNGNKATVIMTGPYEDLTTKLSTLTYSLPIVKQNQKDKVAAIINVDIIISNFKSVYDLISQKDEYTRIALVDIKTDLVINDCFKTPKIITFYETSITGFTKENWKEIKDFSKYTENSTFTLKNNNNTSYYLSRTLIKDLVDKSNVKFILLIFGEESSYLEYRNETQDRIDQYLYLFCTTIIIVVSVMWFVSYFYIFALSKHIVKPLAKLSNLAKSINMKEERKNSTEDIKEQLSKISGADTNTKKLIDSFINLVDQHSGMRKIQNNAGYQDNYIPVYKQQNNNHDNYPRNDYKGELDDVLEHIRYLKNLGENENEDDDQISKQDFDEVCCGKHKCNSSSSIISNRCPNEDFQTEADNMNHQHHNHKSKCKLHQENENSNGKGVSTALTNSANSQIKQEKKYLTYLKEQLAEQKDYNTKTVLSQQILSNFLPQNTQSF